MTEEQTFVVDRIEGRYVVLVGDDDTELVLLRDELPVQVSEGTVLRVRVGTGEPDWTTAQPDADEQSRRLESARKRMEKLRKRDPGGDLKL